MRAMRAIENAPSAKAGSTSDTSPSRPAAGNQPSLTAKTRISSSPSQYTRLERQEEARGITGEMQEPEDDHGHAEKDEDALQEPPQHVANHRSSPHPTLSPAGRGSSSLLLRGVAVPSPPRGGEGRVRGRAKPLARSLFR